jgi:hypothetical protein
MDTMRAADEHDAVALEDLEAYLKRPWKPPMRTNPLLHVIP